MSTKLNSVRSFNTTPHTLDGALLQPVLRFLEVSQCTCVGFAGIGPSLKSTQAIAEYCNQYLVCNTIYSVPVNVYWAILETKVSWRSFSTFNTINVICVTLPWFIQYCNCQGIVSRINPVFG